MRKHKTVIIKAASLEENKARLAEFAKAQGYSAEETAEALAEAKADEPGRDEGKSYFLTEMPVLRAEKWAARALIAIGKGDKSMNGIAGILSMGIEGMLSSLMNISWEDAEPLLDEMLSCVQLEQNIGVYRPINYEAGDIEEVATLVRLRREILGLHYRFFEPAGNSTSATKAP